MKLVADSELKWQSIQHTNTDRTNDRNTTRPISIFASLNSGLASSRITLFFFISVLSKIQCCCGFLESNCIHWHDRAPSKTNSKNDLGILFSSPPFYSSGDSKSKLEKDGGVVYRQSVCTPQEIESIRKEISLVTKRHLTKERSSIAQNRLGATLLKDNASETIRILERGSIHSLVQRLAGSSGNTIHLATEIPVEVRSYEQVGAAMAWHKDDVMFDPPQLEVVFTLENNSDCVTMWVRDVNSNDRNGRIQSQETHPNSMLLLLAGGPDHCVTSLKRGRRVILKCAYVYEGSTYIGEDDYHQFGATKTKGNAKRTAKSKKRKQNRKRS